VSRFLPAGDVEAEDVAWGVIGWRCRPRLTGSSALVVMDVTIGPGQAHAFHLHPRQDQLVIVRAGRIEQWLGAEHRDLGPGDAVFAHAGTVHGSFNMGHAPAHLQIILAPAAGPGGYELVDVSAEDPWRRLGPKEGPTP